MAKDMGVKMAIGTDSHALDHMRFLRFGTAMARRGWLEKKDILNTYDLREIEKAFGR